MKKHSVLLKEELCEGCTNCVKNCPTKAIRVHNGKATIRDELCIDCAECIRICAYHAKYSQTAVLADLQSYRYPIVLIPPSFYGQFKGFHPLQIKQAFRQLGFKAVYDVALAAEALSQKTSEFLQQHPGTYISSSCPVVVRLIQVLYPELTGHLIPFKSPADALAEKVRQEKINSGVPPEDIGIFFITPCPGKNTSVFNPIGIDQSSINQAISVSLAYQAVLEVMNDIQDFALVSEPIPYLGIGWGQVGGEARLLQKQFRKSTLTVSGIHRVKAVLDELSRNNIKGVRYCELAACDYGCVGGVFNVVNPFQASINLRSLRTQGNQMVTQDDVYYNFELTREIESLQLGRLDDNLEIAMEKLAQLEQEIEILPGLDCAACGAPDCKTLAEDIVNGLASRTDCMFFLRKQVVDLADKMSALVHEMPPVMKQRKKG